MDLLWTTYDIFLRQLFVTGELKLQIDDIWGMLVSKDYVPDPLNHTHRSHVSPFGIRGKGYTKGGMPLGGRVVDVRGGLMTLKASPLVWPIATIRAGGLVFYKNSGANEVTDVLIQHMSLLNEDEQEAASTNNEFRVDWPEEKGVLQVDFRAAKAAE